MDIIVGEAAADGSVEVVDAGGRKLMVKEMDPADQLDLFEACAQHSSNQSWVGLALVACSVKSIDGVPVPMPANPTQVKALARQLGRAGIAAAARAVEQTGSAPTSDQVETAKN